MTNTTLISIYVNTWANYNENGADGGFWVELPCDLDEVLEKLSASTGEDIDDMEVFVNDYETNINGLEISENSNISDLNDFAERLETLDEYEADSGSLENALDDMDDYTFYAHMSLEDVAYEIVEECYDLPEFAQRYFDYAAFARDLGFDGYTETENGVIYRS